jgi:hypothetical protein
MLCVLSKAVVTYMSAEGRSLRADGLGVLCADLFGPTSQNCIYLRRQVAHGLSLCYFLAIPISS